MEGAGREGNQGDTGVGRMEGAGRDGSQGDTGVGRMEGTVKDGNQGDTGVGRMEDTVRDGNQGDTGVGRMEDDREARPARLDSESSAARTFSGVTFAKMKGFATTDGPMFEVKLAALLFLRCRNSARVSRFQLATNVEWAGALDDVVLRYTTLDDPATWHTCFVQLKHKERAVVSLTALAAPGGDFALVKYLKSIVDIEHFMTSHQNKSSDPLIGPFENCHFVLYTNAKTNVNATHRMQNDVGELEFLLRSDLESSENENIFGLSEENKVKIATAFEKAKEAKEGNKSKDSALNHAQRETEEKEKACETKKLKTFLDRMTVFAAQPTVGELDNMIKKELLTASFSAAASFNVDQLYPYYESLFRQWWGNSNFILDESEPSNILQQALDQLRLGLGKNDKMLLDINFDERLWETFVISFPVGVSVLHFVVTGSSARIGYTKVIRLLQKQRRLFTSYRLADLLENQDGSLSAWSGDSNSVMIIGHESPEFDSQEPVKRLAKSLNDILTQSGNEKQVIIISLQNVQFIGCLESIFGERYKQIYTSFNLNQLDGKTITRILEKTISLKGTEMTLIPLKTFFRENVELAHDVLKGNLVETIITSTALSIGPELADVVSYYVPRTLRRPDVLKRDVLKSIYFTEVFAVSGVTVQELAALVPHGERVGRIGDVDSGHCQILAVESSDTEYNLSNVTQNKNIHWLHVDFTGELKWVMSKKNIEYVRKYINEERYTTYQPDTALGLDARVNVVIAEPGMGKSTLMDYLAKETKDRNPSLWVIRINLNDHTNLLDQTPWDDAVAFLASAVGIDSREPLELALFRMSFEHTGNVVVLLDGFDEIAPSYSEKALAVLTSVLKTKVKKVWVTSRHSMKDILEQHLSTIAFNMEPFSEQDQRAFFKKFWASKATTNLMPESQLDDFITQLLQLLSDTLMDKDKMLPGIPLQTMILADVFAGHVVEQNTMTLPNKLDLLYLFETFIDKKFQIFIKEKVNLCSKNIKYLLQTIKSKFDMDHMNASLILLVPHNDIQRLHSYEEIMEESKEFFEYVKDANDKTGIVYSVLNNQPKFLHRTFAEYFAALWFSKNHKLNKKFLKEHLYTPGFGVVRSMFDRLMAKGHELHTAVLNNDTLRVEVMLSGGEVDVNSTDKGGRSALHLAAALGYEFRKVRYNYIVDDRFIGPRPKHMVEILLTYGADVNAVDKVMKWTSLEYAIKTTTWDVMEYLLAHEVHSHNPAESSVKESQMGLRVTNQDGRTLLHWACESGHVHLVQALIQSIGENRDSVALSINERDPRGFSPVHLASYRGYSEVVRVLISSGADIRAPIQEGKNCLHIASEKGHLQVAQVLIESLGGDTNAVVEYINIQDLRGNSAVLHASYWGFKDIVRLLLSHGSDIRTRDRWGRTCLHKVSQNSHLQIAEALLDSLGEDDRHLVTEYVNAVDFKGSSAIHLASYSGCPEIIKLLIVHGADIRVHNKKGRNCLHVSAEWNRLSVASALIDSLQSDGQTLREYINARDALDISALQIASTFGFLDIVKLLIEHGGDVWSRDQEGRTCLHVASLSGNLPVARVLIESLGENRAAVAEYINTRDSTGRSANDIACRPDALRLFTVERATLATWLDQILST